MAEERPAVLPEWATTAVPPNAESAPALKIDSGWIAGEAPPHNWFNFLLKNAADWIRYLNERVPALEAARTWSAVSNKEPITATSVGGINGIAGNGSVWMAAGPSNGTDSQVFIVSHAGGNWNQLTANLDDVDLNDIAFDFVGDVFVMVGDTFGGDAAIHTASSVGGSISEKANPKNFDLIAVAVSASGAAVAAGEHDGSDIYAVLSTDAAHDTWTEITSMPGSAGDLVLDIAVAGTTFVAVGQTSGSVPLIWTNTTDGAVAGWSSVSIPAGLTDKAVSVTYDGARFILVGDDGQIAVSVTGATGTWALVTTTPATGPKGAGTINTNSTKADPVSGVILVMNGDEDLRISFDGAVTWAVVPHAPSSVNGFATWASLGFDGTAWAVAHIDATDDVVFGAQSGILPG